MTSHPSPATVHHAAMPEPFGSTRSVVTGRYALLTPPSFVPTRLPGWEKATCHLLISPAIGARFSQLLVILERGGQCVGNTGANQYFIYVLEGAAGVLLDSRKHRLDPGGYAYCPPGQDVQISSSAAGTRLLIFQKHYHPLPHVPRPAALAGHEREVRALPLPGHEDARLQTLLPPDPPFDMAVNISTSPPGAAPAAVECAPTERGLMLLRGQALCRLANDWHPVQAGDNLWITPYCPYWFVAVGKTPATCICYQDANRDPV